MIMKKLLLLSILSISMFTNAQLANNKRLVVPEFGTNAGNNKVKTYFPTLAGGILANPAYTINFSTLGNGLATSASPNVVIMRNNDLFVTLTVGNQRIYKFPGYGINPASAIANVSEITRAGNDYVGIILDAAGNIYCSEGSYNDTHIVKYTIASNYANASKIDLGNGGAQSYFANFAFDASGNLWASDAYQNRIVVIKVANLNNTNAVMNSIRNSILNWNVSNGPIANFNATLAAGVVNTAFEQPEGIAFSADGSLWVGNNNGTGLNNRATLVKLSTGLLADALNFGITYLPSSFLNAANGLKVWNLPNSLNGRSQCGGLQIDKSTDRIYINEQIGGAGLWFDISDLNGMTNDYNTHKLNIVSTNPGNGGIFLADATANFLTSNAFDVASANVSLYPNPSNGNFRIESDFDVTATTASDVLGKQIDVIKNGDNYAVANAQSGIYFLKITFYNGLQTIKKLVVN